MRTSRKNEDEKQRKQQKKNQKPLTTIGIEPTKLKMAQDWAAAATAAAAATIYNNEHLAEQSGATLETQARYVQVQHVPGAFSYVDEFFSLFLCPFFVLSTRINWIVS